MMNDSIPPSDIEHPLEHLSPPSPPSREDKFARECARGHVTNARNPIDPNPDPTNRIPVESMITQTASLSIRARRETGDPGRLNNASNRLPGDPRKDYRFRPISPVGIELDRAIQLMRHPDWWLQEYYSGDHMLIRKTATAVEGIGADGSLAGLPAAVIAAAENTRRAWVIEGICIGDTFTAFELLSVDYLNFSRTPYWLRWGALRELLTPEEEHLQIAETAMRAMAKAQFLERLRNGQKKGFVLRKSVGERVFEPSSERAFALKRCFSASAPLVAVWPNP